MKINRAHKFCNLFLMMAVPILSSAFTKNPFAARPNHSKATIVRQTAQTTQINDHFIHNQIVEQVANWKIALSSLTRPQTNNLATNNTPGGTQKNNSSAIKQKLAILLRNIFDQGYHFENKKTYVKSGYYYNKFITYLQEIIKTNITVKKFEKNINNSVPQNDYFTIFNDNDLSIGNGQKYTPKEVINTLSDSDKKNLINQFLQSLEKAFVDDLKENDTVTVPGSSDKWYDKIPSSSMPTSDLEHGLTTHENYEKLLDTINFMIQDLGLKDTGNLVSQKLKEQIKMDEEILTNKIASSTNLINNVNPFCFYFYENYHWFLWKHYDIPESNNFKDQWNNAFNNKNYIKLSNSINSDKNDVSLINSWVDKTNLTNTSKPQLNFLLKLNNAFKKGVSNVHTSKTVKEIADNIKSFIKNNINNNVNHYLKLNLQAQELAPKQISDHDIIFGYKAKNLMKDFPISINKQIVNLKDNQTNQVKVKLSITIKPELKDVKTTNDSAVKFDIEVNLLTNKTNQDYDDRVREFKQATDEKKTEIITSIKKVIGDDLYNTNKNQLDDAFNKSFEEITKQKDFLNKNNNQTINDLHASYVNNVLKKIKENNSQSADTINKLNEFYKNLNDKALNALKANSINGDNNISKEILKNINDSKNKVINQINGNDFNNRLNTNDLTLLDALSSVGNREKFKNIINFINKINPRILMTSFNTIKNISYYAFTGLSGFVFLSLLIGIRAISRIDTNRFKINKSYLLIITITGALLSGGGSIYLLLGLI